jgi:hypothetical protein
MRLFFNVLAVILLLVAAVLPVSCRPTDGVDISHNKAAIIDQLYLREPNPDFIAESKRTLESAGFTVDVWQGGDITVDFYRKLPSLGYRFIVLRVHSGLLLEMKGDQVVELENTYLFTAENYTTTRYITEQLTDKVSNAMMEEDYPLVFAVNSEFIRDAKGSFNHTVVLAMGCESYEFDDLPQAFIDKGASVFIGWSELVTLEHVDTVTLDLLHNLCTDNMTIAQGISATMTDQGNDPYFDSFLKFFPADSGSRTVQELIR